MDDFHVELSPALRLVGHALHKALTFPQSNTFRRMAGAVGFEVPVLPRHRPLSFAEHVRFNCPVPVFGQRGPIVRQPG